MNIPILYEDSDVLVVNKPSGLIVHSDGRTEEPTLADWVLKTYPEMKNVGEPFVRNDAIIPRPGIVHRLDRETSGVLVIAKTQGAFEYLKNQFQEREIVKVYNAFVYGAVKQNTGTITAPIGRSVKDFRLWSAERGARGELREAVTEYKVLVRGTDDETMFHTFSFLEVRPKTGRTHQIRVHLKAVNHPVVCDTLYAPKRICALGFTRLALHAHSLTFKTPVGVSITAEAPFPDDFANALDSLKE